MGCAESKYEEEAAVAHCRERCDLLAQAIQHRYALADAHAAYARSLRSVAEALHKFLTLPPASSPRMTLPGTRKGDPSSPLPPGLAAAVRAAAPVAVPVAVAAAAAHGHGHSRSHSGSHIEFHDSDPDSDGAGSHIHFHSHSDDSVDSPFPRGGAQPGHTYYNVHYAKSQPPASSVTFEQRPQSPEATVQYYAGAGAGDDAMFSSYPYYSNPYPPQSSNFYPYPPQSSNFYPPYSAYPSAGSFFGSSQPPLPAAVAGASSPSSSRAPPPAPPSPPSVSTWDFLNPFESYESYYEQPAPAPPPYTPSRSSKEVREEEGIPDLEDEDIDAIKQSHNDRKFAPGTSYAGKGKAAKDDAASSGSDEMHLETSMSSGSEEPDITVVGKNVIGGEEKPRHVAGIAGIAATTAPMPVKTYHDDAEVVQEIKTQFERASESAERMSKMLEVGKMPYYQKKSYRVSASMICGWAMPSSAGDGFLHFEEDKVMVSGNLSSTLQKLYMWERKLLEEVKDEEKVRLAYDGKRKELRTLDEKGAEPDKIEAIERTIRKLSSRISIAIQVINTISNKIGKLRDGDLCQQLRELIQGLMQMWAGMMECHRVQCHAISEAKNLDSIVSPLRFDDRYMDAIRHLEAVLVEWIDNFSKWFDHQRSYIMKLNRWLVTGLNHVQEVTDDGPVPYSPGRLGAPLVFIMCNYWANRIEMISASEVVDAMRAFQQNVYNLWEWLKFEQRKSLMANNGMDRDIKSLEREERRKRKALGPQSRKLDLVSRPGGVSLSTTHDGPPPEVGSLQTSLRQIFEAMENFTLALVKAYEDLYMRCEEETERITEDNSRVS